MISIEHGLFSSFFFVLINLIDIKATIKSEINMVFPQSWNDDWFLEDNQPRQRVRPGKIECKFGVIVLYNIW